MCPPWPLESLSLQHTNDNPPVRAALGDIQRLGMSRLAVFNLSHPVSPSYGMELGNS